MSFSPGTRSSDGGSAHGASEAASTGSRGRPSTDRGGSSCAIVQHHPVPRCVARPRSPVGVASELVTHDGDLHILHVKSQTAATPSRSRRRTRNPRVRTNPRADPARSHHRWSLPRADVARLGPGLFYHLRLQLTGLTLTAFGHAHARHGPAPGIQPPCTRSCRDAAGSTGPRQPRDSLGSVKTVNDKLTGAASREDAHLSVKIALLGLGIEVPEPFGAGALPSTEEEHLEAVGDVAAVDEPVVPVPGPVRALHG
jgi:hypothetical protein